MTRDEVAEVLRAQLPELADRELTLLGEGSEHVVFAVDDRQVLSFARHEARASDWLAPRLTAWLAPRLPLAIPVYTQLGEHRGRPFAGYTKLPGESGLRLVDPARHPTLGRRLGEFLRCLHDLPTDTAASLGVTRDDDLVAWSDVAQDDLRVAAARGHVDPAAWQAIVADLPRPAPGPPRLLHGDFAAEHVLLAQDGTPTGVIDWSDAILGDPALDLAGLLHWGGAPLLAVACETYGPIDAATVARARWFATCRALADLVFAEQSARPEYLAAGLRALQWLRAPDHGAP